jgi:hypothetical protein
VIDQTILGWRHARWARRPGAAIRSIFGELFGDEKGAFTGTIQFCIALGVLSPRRSWMIRT